MVALPVLMATTAYVAGVHFGWRRGLSEGGAVVVLVGGFGLLFVII